MTLWVQFQSSDEAAQVALIHPMMRDILHHVMEAWPEGKEFKINEIARGAMDENYNPYSWHCQAPPYRAIDIKLKGILSKEQAWAVRTTVNQYFIYDPHRLKLKVVVVEENPSYHMHIQCHPYTEKIT